MRFGDTNLHAKITHDLKACQANPTSAQELLARELYMDPPTKISPGASHLSREPPQRPPLNAADEEFNKVSQSLPGASPKTSSGGLLGANLLGTFTIKTNVVFFL